MDHDTVRTVRSGTVAAACLSAWLVLCGLSGSLPAHEGHEALPSTGASVHGDELLVSPAAAKAIGLKLHMVRLGDIDRRLQVNARVELPARNQAKIGSLVAGKVTEVLARPGEAVRAGQPLARIESMELESLQSELLQTAARLTLLRRTVQQQQDLSESGAVAGREVLQTQAELRQQQAQHEIARRKLSGLGLDVSAIDRVLETGEPSASVPVVSPISGRVEHADVRPGQLVESTDHLFDVVDLSRVYLVGEVVETDAHEIKPGQPARATFAGPPARDFPGTIDHIRLHMDEQRRMLEVVVSIDNAAGRLRPGMFGRLSIEVAALRQQILCPRGALVHTGLQRWVLRRTGEGKFQRQPVTVAAETREFAVIESGLFPGQQVVVTPTHLLASMFDEASPSDSGQPATRTLRASGSLAVPRANTVGATRAVAASSGNGVDSVTAARAIVELPTGRQAFATSLIEGRVARLLVEPGDEVRAGQVVAELHSQLLRNLQLDLLQAHSKLAWTEDALQRIEPLAQSGLAARQELWERQAERDVLRSQISGLRRKLSLVGLADEDVQSLAQGAGPATGTDEQDLRAAVVDTLAIRAPLDGRIAQIGAVPGQLVHAHDNVVEIQNLATVWVKAFVLEQDAGRVKEGQTAVVRFPSSPSLRLNGPVVRVGPGLVSAERVLPVWIEVANPEEFLKQGMLARVVIQTAPRPAELVERNDP